MDNELFLKRLTELTEWHRPMLGPSGATSTLKRRGRPPEDPELLAEYQEELARIERAEQEPNPCVGPEIIKVKPRDRACEDCGRQCSGGRRWYKKFYTSITEHWRSYCQSCDRYRDPRTGEYTLTQQSVNMVYTNYLRTPDFQEKKSRVDK